ncbi:hypothetical protein VNO80_32100 [Phaseolus coccineus]|uniref:Uncharacterized protein n=2 Tax=Phaseolus coccineus TaxID=3886 RepID=A0AAN9KZW2_PHACN
MHPPSRCACFVVKASHNAHCMVDPPTWVGVTHGGAGSGGRCRFRPTFNLVRENVMCSCGTLVGFGVWLISTLVSTKSGVWLLTVRREGGHHVWLVTGRGFGPCKHNTNLTPNHGYTPEGKCGIRRVCVSRFEDTREHRREGTGSSPWLLHQNHPRGRCWGVETRMIRVGTWMLLLAGSMPRASNGQTRIPLVATLPWVSEDPKVTHVVRPVLATMHGQGGTRGGTVLSDAVHAVNPGRSWSGDPCSSRQ